MEYDYGIIGGGPAGYTAGMMLAKLGHSVVIFEKDKLGGTCLNKGCIPTKSFLHSAGIYKQIQKSAEIGLDTTVNSFDFSKVVDIKNNTVEKLRKGLELAVKNSGANVVYEEAKIKNENTIVAGSSEYVAGKIILATGSKPKEIKGLEFDHKFILSSDDILNLQQLPKSILIIGSGAIGIEWARVLSDFGVEVTIVELAEHLIPLADIEVSKRIERIFKQNKIKFYTNDYVEKIVGNKVTLHSNAEIEPEIILSAVGRQSDNVNIKNIIKLGDACNEIQLAHYAIHQAKNFALNIDYDKNLIPSVIYGEPEIAWVGLREQDGDFDKVVLPISVLGKAWCDNSTDGFIKLLLKNNCIVGAHIVSKEASALIHTLLVAIQNKISVNELKKVCFAHPTYSEGIFETIMRIN